LTKEGKITKVKILQGVNEFLDKETVRVISSSPDWTPGYLDGKPQNVEFAFPVVFKLN
jgi:protein TonB